MQCHVIPINHKYIWKHFPDDIKNHTHNDIYTQLFPFHLSTLCGEKHNFLFLNSINVYNLSYLGCRSEKP